MFWKHFSPPVSALDNLLEKEDCTLTEVLDAEDVLQECKGINNKLLKFLTRQDNIEELVSLVTSEPLDDLDESERFKHPNAACNILTSGAGALVDKLIAEEPLLDKLFEFMQSERPLNSLLASFFSRVVVELFSKRASRMLEYITSKVGLFDMILSHIDTSAIMDLVLGITNAFLTVEERQEMNDWMAENAIVKKLVDMITGGVSGEKQRNASRMLGELHRYGYEFMSMNFECTNQDTLVDALESNEVIRRLLTNIFADTSSPVPFCHGPEFLCTMVMLQRSGTQTNGILAETAQYPNISNEEGAGRVAECTAAFIPDFIQVLSNPPKSAPMRTSVGEIEAPLGAARLSIIRLLTSLLQVSSQKFMEEFARFDVATVLLDLFFQYQWNNFLHSHVEQVVSFVMSLASDADYGLRHSLVVKGRLLQRLAEAGMSNESDQAEKKRRRGYMGHVVTMSNRLTNACDSADDIKEWTAAMSASDDSENSLDEWNAWIDGPLDTVNAKNSMVLGGTIPSIMSMDCDSDGDIPIDTPEQQSQPVGDSFSFYNSQPMATDFADNFGFDEEDFTTYEESENAGYQHGVDVDFTTPATDDATSANLFEQACAERLRGYSSDEEDDSEGEGSNGGPFDGGDDWIQKEPRVDLNMSAEDDDSDSSDDGIPFSERLGGGLKTERESSISSNYSVEDSNSSNDDEEALGLGVPPVDKLQHIRPAGSANDDDNDLFVDFTQPGVGASWQAKFENMDTSSGTIWGDEETAAASSSSASSASRGADVATGWANFGGSDENSDTKPFFSTQGERTPSATTNAPDDGDIARNAVDHNSSGEEVSSTDESDDSDERDGSYSFGNLNAGSDDDDRIDEDGAIDSNGCHSDGDDCEPQLKSVSPLRTASQSMMPTIPDGTQGQVPSEEVTAAEEEEEECSAADTVFTSATTTSTDNVVSAQAE